MFSCILRPSMKWALVLSGGGAAGLAYIGFFKALEELNLPKPSCIVGCSMGAVIGGLYACGKTAAEMEAVFGEPFELSRYVGRDVRIPLFKNVLTPIVQYGSMLKRLLSGMGADPGDKVYQFFLELSDSKSFEDCAIPFFCNALDLCSGKEVVLTSGLLAQAMRASTSYPGLFVPMPLHEALLIDACVIDNTPVRIARAHGYRHILALTLGSCEPIAASELDSTLAVLMRTLNCTTSHIAVSSDEYPTTFIDFASQRSAHDFSNPENQISFGYQKAMEKKALLQAFFAQGVKGYIQRALLTQKTKKEYAV